VASERLKFEKTDATMNSAGGHVATWATCALDHRQMDGGKLDGKQVFSADAVALSQRIIARHTVESSKRWATFTAKAGVPAGIWVPTWVSRW
jgi:hypothetical protein